MKKENSKYILHEDPGHGWLQVPIKEIEDLGIQDKISVFSYVDDGFLYLEEDVDQMTFIRAYKKKFGEEPEIEVNDSYTLVGADPCFIRDLDNFVTDANKHEIDGPSGFTFG